ncbi:MAG: phosphoglycerate mutase family protein [Eubacteriales bacterium]|nr:phosphoglycerate mutase family protein [Eubacteriales bacterium]
MRLLFIRHAEPDYSTDSLTEKGRREAALLAKTAPSLRMDHCFVSPLGRAQETAAYCLEAVGKTAVTLDWLEEFDAPVDLNRTPELLAAYPNVKPEAVPPSGLPAENGKEAGNPRTGGSVLISSGSNAQGSPYGEAGERTQSVQPGKYRPRRPWDVGQIYYAEHPELMDPFRWRESEIYLKSKMPSRYDEVVSAFDALLASYGYVHENGLYRVERESRETLVFFCHFGVTCVLLSALWNTSPFFLWQNLAMLPSSVTELATEERVQGAALFRAQRIGDLSHLYAGNEPASFACRFCEVYSDFSVETGRH